MNNIALSTELNSIIFGLEKRAPWSEDRGGHSARGVERLSSSSIYQSFFGHPSFFSLNQRPLDLLNRQITHLTLSLNSMASNDFWDNSQSLAIIAEQIKLEIKRIEGFSNLEKIIIKVWTVVYALFFGTQTSDLTAAQELKSTILPKYEAVLKQKLAKEIFDNDFQPDEHAPWADSIDMLMKWDDKVLALNIVESIPKEERPSVVEALYRLKEYFLLVKGIDSSDYKLQKRQQEISQLLLTLPREKRIEIAENSVFLLIYITENKHISNTYSITDVFKSIAQLPYSSDPAYKIKRDCFYRRIVKFCSEENSDISLTLTKFLFAWDLDEEDWNLFLKERSNSCPILINRYGNDLKNAGVSVKQILSLTSLNTFHTGKTSFFQTLFYLITKSMSDSEKAEIIQKMKDLENLFPKNLVSVLELIQEKFPATASFEQKIKLLDLLTENKYFLSDCEVWCFDLVVLADLKQLPFERWINYLDATPPINYFYDRFNPRTDNSPQMPRPFFFKANYFTAVDDANKKLVLDYLNIKKLPKKREVLHKLFKKWAVKNHPDKNKGLDAKEKFQILKSAIDNLISTRYSYNRQESV